MNEDLFGPVPEPPKKKVSAKASQAAKTLRASRRAAVDAGIERGKKAADKADRVHGNWLDKACELMLRYGRANDDDFMTEDAAQFAYANGLPRPPDGRAWGAVTNRLTRGQAGARIERVGFQTDNYGSPKSVWRVA